jgi:hypothetical protein
MKLAFPFLAALAAVALVRPACADDEKKTLVTRDHWKTGDVVTATEHETKHEVVKVTMGEQTLQDKTEDTATDVEWVTRCDEADASGKLLKAVVHVVSWSWSKTGEEKDTSLKGAVIDVTGGTSRSWKARGDAKVGEGAKAWLDQTFGEKSHDDNALDPTGPLAPGESWTIDMAKAAQRLGGGGLEIDVAKSSGKGTLERYEGSNAVLSIALEMATKGLPLGPGQTAAWTEGGVLQLDVDMTVPVDGSMAGRTGASKFSMKGKAEAQGANVALDVAGASTISSKAGGSIPETK